MRTAVFPGSFNPFTIGHADIVERGLKIFDKIVIAVGYNEQKGMAQMAAIKENIERLYAGVENVEVRAYSTLTTELAREIGAQFILRSVRSVKDYEYELQMADVNNRLTGIETVVLFARPELASISSSVVRELMHFGQDVSEFLP